MKIRVHAHTSTEAMFEAGKKAGLSDEAANFFRFFQEVELELEVDPATGTVISAEVF